MTCFRSQPPKTKKFHSAGICSLNNLLVFTFRFLPNSNFPIFFFPCNKFLRCTTVQHRVPSLRGAYLLCFVKKNFKKKKGDKRKLGSKKKVGMKNVVCRPSDGGHYCFEWLLCSMLESIKPYCFQWKTNPFLDRHSLSSMNDIFLWSFPVITFYLWRSDICVDKFILAIYSL